MPTIRWGDKETNIDPDKQYLTIEEAAYFIREQYGDNVMDLNDSELVDWFAARNPQINDILYPEPTVYEITKQMQEKAGHMIKRDIPGFLARSAAELIDPPDWYKENINIARKANLEEEIRREFPEYSDELVRKKVDKQYKPVKLPHEEITDWSDAFIAEGIKERLTREASDPSYAAMAEWAKEESFADFDTWFNPKAYYRAFANGLPSMLVTYGTGAAVGLATRNPLLTKMVIGGLSGSMEGGSQLQDGVLYLMQDMEIDPEEAMDMQNDFIDKIKNDREFIKEELRRNNPDMSEKNINELANKWSVNLTEENLNKLVADFRNDKFIIDKENRRVFLKGLPLKEAVDTVIGTAVTYGMVAGVIEQLPAGKYMKSLGFEKQARLGLFGKILKKVNKAGRRNKLIQGGRPVYKIFSTAGVEALEEFTQYTAEVALTTTGPTAYKIETFGEEWDWGEALEGAVGGFLLGGTGAGMGVTMDKLGITDRIKNIRRLATGRLAAGEFVVRQDKKTKLYHLYYKDDDNQYIKYTDEIGDRETSFQNKKNALAASRRLENDIRDTEEVYILDYHSEYVGATVKTESDKDGIRVVVYNSKNEVLSSEVFSDKKVAKKESKDLNKSINIINSIKVKHEAQAEKGKVIQGSVQEENIALKTFTDKTVAENELNAQERIMEEHNIFEDSAYINSILKKRGVKALEDAGISLKEFKAEVEKNSSYDTAKTLALLKGKPKPKTKLGTVREITAPPSGSVVEPPTEPFIPEAPDEPFIPDEPGDIKIPDDPGPKVKPEDLPGKSVAELQQRHVDLTEELKNTPKENKMHAGVLKGRITRVEKELESRGKKPVSLVKKIKEPKPLTVSQLKKELKKQGLPTTGKKQDLIDRLNESRKTPEKVPEFITTEGIVKKSGKKTGNLVHKMSGIDLESNEDAVLTIITDKDGNVKSATVGNEKVSVGKLNINTDKFQILRNIDNVFQPKTDIITSSPQKKPGKEREKKVGITKDEQVKLDKDSKKKQLESRLSMLENKFQGKIKWKVVDKPDVRKEAWVNKDTGDVFINLPYANLSSPFHEFLHPFLRELRVSNPRLFDNIEKQLLGDDRGKNLNDQVRSEYSNEGLTEDEMREEFMAFALEKSTDKRYSQDTPFMKAIKKLWHWIKQFLLGKNYTENIYIGDINAQTTLGELIDIIGDAQGRYKIDLLDTAFYNDVLDAQIEESNEIGAIDTDILNVIPDMLRINELSGIFNDITNDLLRLPPHKYEISIEKWNKWLKKRYPIRTKRYRGKYIEGIRKGDKEYIQREIKNLKNRIRESIPHATDLPEAAIEKLSNTLELLSGEISFRYKLVEILQQKDPTTLMALSTLSGTKGLKKNEKKHVAKFVLWLKNETNAKSIPAGQLSEIYQDWSNKSFQLFYTSSKQYSNALNYDGAFEKNPDLWKDEAYRILIHNDQYYTNLAHVYKMDYFNLYGSPIGWYGVKPFSINDLTGTMGILLHEYQTDFLDHIFKAIKRYKKDIDVNFDSIDYHAKRNSLIGRRSSVKYSFDGSLSVISGYFDVLTRDGTLAANNLPLSVFSKSDNRSIGFNLIDNNDLRTMTEDQLLEKYTDPKIEIRYRDKSEVLDQLKSEIKITLESTKMLHVVGFDVNFEYNMMTWIYNRDINKRKEAREVFEWLGGVDNVDILKFLEKFPNKGNTLYKKILKIHIIAMKMQRRDTFVYYDKLTFRRALTKLAQDISPLYPGELIELLGKLSEGDKINNKYWSIRKRVKGEYLRGIKNYRNKMAGIKNLEYKLKSLNIESVEKYVRSAVATHVNEDIRQYISYWKALHDSQKSIVDHKDVKEAQEDIIESPITSNKYMQLYDKWFETLILNSIQHAEMSLGDTGDIYIAGAYLTTVLQYNPIAEKLYRDDIEGKWNFLASLFHKRIPQKGVIVRQLYIKYLENETDIFEKYHQADIEEQMDSRTVRYDKYSNDLAKLIINHFESFVGSKYYDQLESTTKDYIKDGFRASGKGTFMIALGKIGKKYKIKYEVGKFGIFTENVVKIDRKSIPDDITPYRFKKILKEKAAEELTPQDETQVKLQVQHRVDVTESKIGYKAIFEDAWKHVNRIARQQIGKGAKAHLNDFRIVMKDVLGIDDQDIFDEWYNEKVKQFPGYVKDRKTIGESKDAWMESDDIRSEVIDIFDEDMQENLDELAKKGATNEKSMSIYELSYWHDLGIMVTKGGSMMLKREAQKIDTFKEWSEKSLTKRARRSLKTLTDRQFMGAKRYYNRIRSSLETNTDKGGSRNERDNYTVFIGSKAAVVELKGPVSKKTGNKHSNREKITLFENSEHKRLFHWIHGSDVTEYGKVIRDEDGAVIRDSLGVSIREVRSKYDFFNPKMDFSETQEVFSLSKLQFIALKKKNLAIAFSAGDRESVALVDVKPEHYNIAKNAKKYWEKELEDGYLVDDNQVNNFIGNHLKLNKSSETYKYYIASNIAVHEAMKKVVPMYLHMNGSEVFKRLKIPFTSVTISHELPDMSVKIFDPRRVVFKSFGKEVKAIQTIKGVGVKYIGDGGTLTSRAFFDASAHFVGSNPKAGKLKTVIYEKNDNQVLAVKHQHFIPHRGLEIWEGNKKISYIDDNNNIIDEETGQVIDMLMTEDEAKIHQGYDIGEIFEIKGSSVGFIMFDDRAPNTVKHPMQWYNHISDKNVINQWRNTKLNEIHRELKKMVAIANTPNAPERVVEYLKRLAGRDTESFYPAVLELAKLGGGLHAGLEPMLNVLMQTGGMSPILQMEESIGTRLYMVPNLDGRLKKGEIGIARESAEEVFKAYAKAHGIEYIGENIKSIRKTDNATINKWLENNHVEVFTSRSPIPHAGGAGIFKVRFIHSRNLLVELNPYDTFALFEGDYDGDELHIEFMDQRTTDIYRTFFNNLKAEGINLKDYKAKKAKFDLSLMEDRFKLIETLTFGKKAIAEIANTQSIYRQLLHALDHIVIDGVTIRLKEPNSNIKFAGKTMSVEKMMRVLLQAAVDNGEYMLLKGWNYKLDTLYATIFKRDDGKLLTKGQLEALKILINIHKHPRAIMRGSEFGEKYRLDSTMNKSEEFFVYKQDRVKFIKKKHTDIMELIAEEPWRETKGLVPAPIDDVVFKDNIVSPMEDIAIAPYSIWEAYSKQFKLIGHDKTPVRFLPEVHVNAHYDAMVVLDGLKKKIFETAINEDLQGYEASAEDKQHAIMEESIKGIKYMKAMANELYTILSKMKSIGPQAMDRNDDLIEWKEKHQKKYNDLSRVARVAATIKFLERWYRSGKFEKAPRVFPPVSSSKNEYSLLDHKIIELYFNEYNKIMFNPENRKVNKMKGPEYTLIQDTIKDLCS